MPVTTTLRAGKPIPLFEPPIFIAALFTDGSSSGDSALLARLLARRRSMLQAVELALDILSSAGGRNVPRSQLVEQFKMMADSASRWYLPREEQVGRTLYQSIAAKLMNLPPSQLGFAFPPSAFVEQETEMLNRQRTSLLESQPGLNMASVITPR